MLDKKQYTDHDLKEISRNLQALHKEGKKILDNCDFQRLFNITRNTALSWRQTHKIKFSRVGRRVYYRVEDVEEMMEELRVKS